MRNWFFYGILLVLMSFIALYSLEALLPVAFVLGMSGAFVDIFLVTLIQSWSLQRTQARHSARFLPWLILLKHFLVSFPDWPPLRV